MADKPFRVLPRVTDQNEHFWRGGADGELRFLRCQNDGYWIHPPAPICPQCLRKDIAPEAVSGNAVVHTFTINEQAWIPTLDPPYVIAIVEMPEQVGLRLTTNIIDCEPGEVFIGMPVHVVFDNYDDDVWLPFFAPIDQPGAD